jgi:hypothetical protein
VTSGEVFRRMEMHRLAIALSLLFHDAPISPRSPWFDPNEEEIVIPAEGDCLDLQDVLSQE